jgi:hypothetical protein
MAQNTPDRTSAPLAAPSAPVQQMRFPLAAPSVQVILVTAFFLVTALFFGGKAVLDAANGQPVTQGDIVLSVLVAGMIVWRALGAVRGYVIETGSVHGPELVIQRVAPWATVIVSLGRLRAVDANPAVRSVLNTSFLSLGGLFGWAGPALVPELGPVQIYAINRQRIVLLELAPRTDSRYQTSDGSAPRGAALLLSPRDPQGFAAALEPFRQAAPPPGLPTPGKAPAASPAPSARSATRPASSAPPPALRKKKR